MLLFFLTCCAFFFQQESYDRAKAILKNHHSEHKALAQALMKYETLDAEDIKAIIEGRKIVNKSPSPSSTKSGNKATL